MFQKNEFFKKSFGAYYGFNQTTGNFDFYYGEPLKDAPNPHLAIEYPDTVYLVEGTHPEIFSANGSHGIWGQEGKKKQEGKPSEAETTKSLDCFIINHVS